VVNSHGRFVWYELVTTDIKAAVAFYSKVMGWNAWDVSAPGKDYILFGDGKGSIAGLMRLPDDVRQRGGQPAWLGYVGVDDVDATVARLTRLGGSVDVPPTDASGISRFSVCADPQRARLALFKWLKPEQQPQTGPDEPGRVGWHELLAADPEQAWAFYAELFGWQKEDADRGAERPYRFFSAGGVTIGSILASPRRPRRRSGSIISTSATSTRRSGASRPVAARFSRVRWKCRAAPGSPAAPIPRAPCSLWRGRGK